MNLVLSLPPIATQKLQRLRERPKTKNKWEKSSDGVIVCNVSNCACALRFWSHIINRVRYCILWPWMYIYRLALVCVLQRTKKWPTIELIGVEKFWRRNLCCMPFRYYLLNCDVSRTYESFKNGHYNYSGIWCVKAYISFISTAVQTVYFRLKLSSLYLPFLRLFIDY